MRITCGNLIKTTRSRLDYKCLLLSEAVLRCFRKQLSWKFRGSSQKRICHEFYCSKKQLGNRYYFLRLQAFFFKQRLFSSQPQCYLNFSWIELQMLLRCCLIHITIIILRLISYLVYLCPCLDLGLLMSYLCDLFFHFQPHFQCH